MEIFNIHKERNNNRFCNLQLQLHIISHANHVSLIVNIDTS